MNPVLVSLITAAIHIAVVYFGIQRFNLSYWPMMGLVLLTTILLSVITKSLLPPSSLIQNMHKRLMNSSAETTSELTLLDSIALIAVLATAALLWNRYGGLQWFGIYIASCIIALVSFAFL